jgi:hypothetical protein
MSVRSHKKRRSSRSERAIELEKIDARLRVSKIITERLGRKAYDEFLVTPQPSFDDLTGFQILELFPNEALERLSNIQGDCREDYES